MVQRPFQKERLVIARTIPDCPCRNHRAEHTGTPSQFLQAEQQDPLAD